MQQPTRVSAWRPLLIPEDSVGQFLDQHPDVEQVDVCDEQLRELEALNGPTFAQPPSVCYWVRWRNTLVRMLPQPQYEVLVVARNHVLFTDAQRATLKTKRVGFAGLSVGSRTLDPLAHGPELGELRLADMDTASATNLSRLPFGIADLGTPKTVLAARMVTEVRPWANVTLYEEGLTFDNLEAFLTGLDIVVDAMDDPAMKLALREMAARLGVDVIMGTDIEQVMIDFEPYATHPHYVPFGGRVRPETLELLRSSDLTPPQRLGAVAEIVGLYNLTVEGLQMALALMTGRLTSMSQLATTASIVGGAVARMIHLRLCGQPVQTGRTVLGVETTLQGGRSAVQDAAHRSLLSSLNAAFQAQASRGVM